MITANLIPLITYSLLFEVPIAVSVIVIVLIMTRQDTRIIWANVLLGLIYGLFSLYLWISVNQWLKISIATEWSPLNVELVYNFLPFPPPSMPLSYSEKFNIPFLLFWVILAVNSRFIVKSHRVVPKFNQLKQMILTNALLSLVYVFSNFILWSSVNQWIDLSYGSEWSPIFITPINLAQPAIQPSVQPLLNIPLMLFLFLLALNLYFIIKVQRSKENKPTT